MSLSSHSGQPTLPRLPRPVSGVTHVLLVSLFILGSLGVTARQASAQAWTLTKAQRQAYLQYYAPVILKRGDENNDKGGRDWLTNFDFDQDGDFSTNRVNWLNINQYVALSASGPSYYDRWRIRPTLYTALIEYMEGSGKSLVLLYHVYNAADKDGGDIHDWERVEIVVHGVNGTPGTGGEYVNHVTVTLHPTHIIRRYYDYDLQFMPTSTGRHVLLWQADESNDIPPATHAHELRFVTNPYSWIASQAALSAFAEVNINGKDEKKNVHYVFVPEDSQAAIEAWDAKALSYSTAASLASNVDNGDTVAWSQVKRITYELQDLADIFPTHWQYNSWPTHWLSSTYQDVLLESPIVSETGQLEVSPGLQRFYTKSRDIGKSDLTDGRSGIPDKNWFYGSYSAQLDSDFSVFALDYQHDDFQGFEGNGTDSYGLTRGAASGYYNSHGAYWWQHDYFVHSGAIDTASTRESGMWLQGEWYTAANGGFDGRWVQLFDDRPGEESRTPYTVKLSYLVNTQRCGDTRIVTATAAGGQPPYTFTWSNGTSATSNATSQVQVPLMTTIAVTVQDARGQTRSASVYVNGGCRDPLGGNR
jgi:hypothetical protein